MHVKYPKKHPQCYWDPLKVEYPVRLSGTEPVISSETIARKWREQPEILPEQARKWTIEMNEHSRDYPTCGELRRSQTSVDFGYKMPEEKRHNKHTPCDENKYIYQPSKSMTFRPPACRVHGTTEMKDSYTTPITPSRLVTDKDQFKHPASLCNMEISELCWQKGSEPIDTTHEGYEKYLDPYLTTSRLHHRPYTADQLQKISNCRDIATYYTLGNVQWVWSTKPEHEEFFPRVRGPKPMSDREKFKGNFREIRAHNKLQWVPGSFRTENKDNYALSQPILENNLDEYEEEVRSSYQRSIAKLKTNSHYEDSYIGRSYRTEGSQIGSKKPICSIFEQCMEKNKRLTSRVVDQ